MGTLEGIRMVVTPRDAATLRPFSATEPHGYTRDAAGQTSPPVCSPSRPDPARESVAMTREAGTFSPTTAMVPDETSGQVAWCRHETAAVGAFSICSGRCRTAECDCQGAVVP